ncbi:hypothetical protein MMC09_001616 [Bachmanniomyces sp. S44760]|nr:hypothetical protein [Bachmanniomyces sp. S44760]
MNCPTIANATLAAILVNGTKAKFDIGTCLNTVRALQSACPQADIPLRLNLTQCYRYCGKGIGPYEFWDVIDALTTWVFPLFNLLGNICITTPALLSGRRRHQGYTGFFAAICHLLADPIDAIWSLETKLDTARRLRLRCKRVMSDALQCDEKIINGASTDLATVCYALDDFGPDRLEERVDRIVAFIQNSKEQTVILEALQNASQDLALGRVNNTLHSGLAIILYGIAIFSGLVRNKSTDNIAYHQPHTIALRELYYWLFLAIILSSAAGKWPGYETPRKILKRFEKEVGLDFDLPEITSWDGGNYTWRPSNNIFCSSEGKSWRSLISRRQSLTGLASNDGDRGHLLYLAISLAAVLSSWLVSFSISWRTPTIGLGGRGLCEIVFITVWIMSFFGTHISGVFLPRRSQFICVTWKDGILSFGMLFVLFAAFQGWYNSCNSWTAYFSRGAQGAYLDLNMKTIEVAFTFEYYLVMILVALVVQFGLAGYILYLNWSAVSLADRGDQEGQDCTKAKPLNPRSIGRSPMCDTVAADEKTECEKQIVSSFAEESLSA